MNGPGEVALLADLVGLLAPRADIIVQFLGSGDAEVVAVVARRPPLDAEEARVLDAALQP